MDYLLAAVTALHILAGVFWAGTVFTMARTFGQGVEKLGYAQIGSGTVAVLTGGYLWHLTREGSFGASEKVLAFGGVSAIFALLLLIATQPVVNKLRGAGLADQAPLRRVVGIRERIAGVLLVITIVCMAINRYV